MTTFIIRFRVFNIRPNTGHSSVDSYTLQTLIMDLGSEANMNVVNLTQLAELTNKVTPEAFCAFKSC